MRAPSDPPAKERSPHEATERLDYSQALLQLRARNIQAELLEGFSSLGCINLMQPGSWRFGGISRLGVSAGQTGRRVHR